MKKVEQWPHETECHLDTEVPSRPVGTVSASMNVPASTNDSDTTSPVQASDAVSRDTVETQLGRAEGQFVEEPQATQQSRAEGETVEEPQDSVHTQQRRAEGEDKLEEQVSHTFACIYTCLQLIETCSLLVVGSANL